MPLQPRTVARAHQTSPAPSDEPTSGIHPVASGGAHTSFHAIHFLDRLQRVHADDAELALTLYHDADLLRAVLDAAALPSSAERVAIALSDDRDAASVVVTRTGRFVTCLGYGMRVGQGTSVISRKRLDAVTSKVERMRERIAAVRRAKEQGDSSTLQTLLNRLRTSPLTLAQEDVATLRRFQPLIGSDCARELRDVVDQLRSVRPVLARFPIDLFWQGELADVAMLHDRASRIASHLAVITDPEAIDEELSGLGRGEPWWTLAATVFESGTYDAASRALWLLGQHPDAVLPWMTSGAPSSMHIALLRELGLATVTLASPAHRVRASQSHAHGVAASQGHSNLDRYSRAIHRFAVAVGQMASSVTERPEAFARVASIAGGQVLEQLERAEAMSDEEATAALASQPDTWTSLDDDALTTLAALVPVSSLGDPEALYLPERFARLRSRPHLALALESLAQFAGPCSPVVRPVQETKVGRNESCPCGSGRKYKRCCGAH